MNQKLLGLTIAFTLVACGGGATSNYVVESLLSVIETPSSILQDSSASSISVNSSNNGNSIDSGASHSTSSLTSASSTVQTDNMFIRTSYQGKSFINDGIGLASFASNIDGDTTKFWVGTEGIDLQKITVRYLGIDAPESIGLIEPWGMAASRFVVDALSNAYLIVLDIERNIYDTFDPSGNYLGFVWYQKTANSKLRMLNLELVELGYAYNRMVHHDTLYYDYFKFAEEYAISYGLKIHGQTDPDVYLNEECYAISIAELRKNYSYYGENDTLRKNLIIEALVVGMIGDHMVLRDLEPDPNKTDGSYAGIYAFLGYGSGLSSMVKVGYIVRFYCNASEFLDIIQLTNVNAHMNGAKKFEIIAKDVVGPITNYEHINVTPTIIESTTATKPILQQRVGDFVETTVTIREIMISDYDENGDIITGTESINYYRKDAKNNMTVYAKLNSSLVFNLRVDGTCFPYPSHELFEVGETYRVRGYLVPYYENYQLQMFNNIAAHENIVKVVT